jgi:hypothetical protein
MSTMKSSRVRRTVERVKTIWSELSYVQRRLFEIQTGLR